MKRLIILLAVMVLVVGCGGATATPDDSGIGVPPPDDTAGDAGEPNPTPPEPSEAPPEPTEAPPDYPQWELVVTGPEETVFDWSEMNCEINNLPDAPTHAFRDANGMVQLIISHFINYRMVGPDLNNLTIDCNPVLVSDFDPDPGMYNDAEWLNSLYTEDGQTIYALIHNEYRGHTHEGMCPSGDYLTCLDASMTMAISTDGGTSYQDIATPPNHMVATLPMLYNNAGRPTGVRGPVLIKGPDDYFYVFINTADYARPDQAPEEENQRLCLMRSDNLDDPKSWRYWDGEGFNGQWSDPYADGPNPDWDYCEWLEPFDLPGHIEGVVYNEALGQYISVGIAAHPTTSIDDLMWGVYYSFSPDLIHWERRRLLYEVPIRITVADPENDLMYAYPNLIDPDSESRTFLTVDDGFYLYLTRANNGDHADRDLIRIPVELRPAQYTPPAWSFDADGDLEGWWLENQLENPVVSGGVLALDVTGDDPFMSSPGFEFPAAEFGTIQITMRVTGDQPSSGQIFFLTDTDPDLDEPKTARFEVIADGEFHTYEVDMTGSAAWAGLITQIRIDPVEGTGYSAIEIDSITVAP